MGSPPALTDVGIVAMSVYTPRTAVSQAALEIYDKASVGKYTVGLGQSHMSFVTDREDVISLALTAVDQLVSDAKIDYSQIGRLEVGTETVLDKSKSIKTSLMRLFKQSGNCDVEGLDNTNACYGATSALFNAVAWMESTAWDGRYAIVVATDIAVYEPGPARPTGGAGAVAILIGKGEQAVIRFEIGLRATCMGDTYDFFKPRLGVEYPTVKGQETVDTFVHAIDHCYDQYRQKFLRREGKPFTVAETDFAVFHSPFNRMVQKSFARLVYNDFLRSKGDPFYEEVERYRYLAREKSHRDREATKAFVKLSRDMYEQKCAPGTWLAIEIGNCYTASLYSSLASLISERGNSLVGKRILMYSFGSGFAASMFSLRVVGKVDNMVANLRLRERLADRIIVEPEEYIRILKVREKNYCRFGYLPEGSLDWLYPGSFFLKEVASLGERDYDRVPHR